MTTNHAYAVQANATAGTTRARTLVFRPCSTVSAPWSPIFIGTAMDAKHGPSRRTSVSLT